MITFFYCNFHIKNTMKMEKKQNLPKVEINEEKFGMENQGP